MPPSDHVSTEPELAPEPATKPARQSHRQARIEHLVTLATNAFAKHEICSLTETSIVIKRRLEDGSWSVSHATEIVAGALSHLIVTGDIDTVVFARQGGSLRARLGWIAPTIANADVAAKYLSGRDADFDYLVEKATIGMSCGRKLATEFVAELAEDLIADLVEDAEAQDADVRAAKLREVQLPSDESEVGTFLEALEDAGISDAWEYASWLYAVAPRVVYAWAACRKAAELIDAAEAAKEATKAPDTKATDTKATRRQPRRWRERGDDASSTWAEVSRPDADPVSLSGPGPCRGMRQVTRAELERDFEEVLYG